MSITSPDVAPDLPAWQLADDELAAEIGRLDHTIRVASARTVELAAQAAQRGLPARAGHRRLSGWLRQVLATATPGEAARLAARAETLFTAPLAAELAPTRQALQTAAITGAQADVITAAITAVLPPVVPAGTVAAEVVEQAQTFLLDHARFHEPTTLARLATHLRHRLDPDADDRLARDEKRQDAARGLTLSRTGSGLVHVEGLLTPRCEAALTASIDAWSAPQPAADGTPDPRTGAQRRHDGLQRLCEEAVAQPGLLPASHGSPYRIVTTVGAETLAAALAAQPAQGVLPAELADGTPLSTSSLAEIACSADLMPVLVDGDGNPLDVGHTQYAFPTKQRLAIALRDRHCTYPRCTAPPPWCDVHHLNPYSQGGETAVSNGTLLCGRHHRHIHTTGMTGRLTDGHITWSTDPPDQQPSPTTRATTAVDHLARRWRSRQQE